ncbi:sugar-binding transcriptional regulator [Alkaliphilus peptidifermentans]|uniref:Central glycolytic genes regulator n=1 Tax=Alkaliphilus peptidifermentans DSM 18978 TaxID=1120976 RepID=A0A1G5KSP8_9FIRM|nr:sugar-binding domain-containing protein [Alkaliphilus peptidifermentans]SCZ03673.1 central glycolytic genes regulator [Alkaliphilus peptidifermentans DSM 18978]
MKDIIEIQKIIVPETFTLLEKRYEILRNISALQPIGRRALSNRLHIGERIVRGEVEFFNKQGLIHVDASGMTVSNDGETVIEGLKEFIYDIRGIKDLEKELKRKLNIKEVIIVPGNLDIEDYVFNDISKATSKLINQLVNENDIIGVTGGNTMAAVAEGVKQQSKDKNITVVPARGGLGRRVESQANTIAAKLANKLKGNYQMLHVSDTLSKEILKSIMEDPEISKITELIKQVNLLIFGIGRADKMAKRRELPEDIVQKLTESRAVAEAFGFYFNIDGEIVYEMKTIGIQFSDFINIPNAIGVAGGTGKAEAIYAITKLKKDMILVTDEGATREILENF